MPHHRPRNRGFLQHIADVITDAVVICLGMSAIKWLFTQTSPTYHFQRPTFCSPNATTGFISNANITFDYLQEHACHMPSQNFQALKQVQPNVLNAFSTHTQSVWTKDQSFGQFTQQPGIGKTMGLLARDPNIDPGWTKFKPKDESSTFIGRLEGIKGESCETVYFEECPQHQKKRR